MSSSRMILLSFLIVPFCLGKIVNMYLSITFLKPYDRQVRLAVWEKDMLWEGDYLGGVNWFKVIPNRKMVFTASDDGDEIGSNSEYEPYVVLDTGNGCKRIYFGNCYPAGPENRCDLEVEVPDIDGLHDNKCKRP